MLPPCCSNEHKSHLGWTQHRGIAVDTYSQLIAFSVDLEAIAAVRCRPTRNSASVRRSAARSRQSCEKVAYQRVEAFRLVDEYGVMGIHHDFKMCVWEPRRHRSLSFEFLRCRRGDHERWHREFLKRRRPVRAKEI